MPDLVQSNEVTWVRTKSGVKVPVFYANNGQIVQALVQYALALASDKESRSEQAFKTAIEDVGYHLGAFQSFLDEKGLDWTKSNDVHLKLFRDWVLARVMASPLCRSELSAKRTTNRYLRSVYRFLLWAQEEVQLVHSVMGWPNAPVKSLLPQKRIKPQDRFPAASLYPHCFTKCGQGSRFTYQYVASGKDIDRLLEHFFEHHSLAVAERNALMTAIIDHVGWRQGSVVHLSTRDFDDVTLTHAKANGYAWVKPAIQKFGYENSFEVPLALVERVRKYIAGPRQRVLSKLCASEVVAQNRLFLNLVTAEPLSPRAVSQILSRAFKRIGAPMGAGAHSLRRKFGDERIEIEIAARKRENKTTDPVNVGIVLQRALGQSAMRSQEAYSRAIGRATWGTTERRQQARIQDLEHENALLRAQVKAIASDAAEAPTKKQEC